MKSDLHAITPRLASSVHFLAHRRMLLPVLLLLSSHRQLAFVVGQGLWLCSPFDMLAPEMHLSDWAALLSDQRSGAVLEQMLETALQGAASGKVRVDESL